MADLFLLLAGIVLFFKKEVRISSKKTLSGRPVKILATLYVLPFTVGFVASFVASAIGIDPAFTFWLSMPLIVIAVLITLYLIVFYKPTTVGS